MHDEKLYVQPHSTIAVQSEDGPLAEGRAPGTVVFLPVEKELADEMQRLKLPAVYHLDHSVKQHIDRLRAIVLHRGMESEFFAQQSAGWLLQNCHCEQVGTLDFAEMGFEGESDTFPDWFEDLIGMGRYESRFDFIEAAAQRAKWIESRISFEPTGDGEELVDPIGTVDSVAFHGVLGEIVNKLLPVTEANGLFILAHLLAMCGAAMGRKPHFGRGLDAHMNPQFAIIGPTARGRKRTSRLIAERSFKRVDGAFAENNIFDGLASARGLMEHLRDAGKRMGDKGKEIDDKGVDDKRRLFIEEELASVLKHGNRDNETLLPLIRQFSDSKEKIHMATKCPITVTGAHLSIVGHGTPSETRSLLMDRDVSGGTWNRFIWLFGVRHQSLPGGADVDDVVENYLSYEVSRLKEALSHARATDKIVFAPRIGERWKAEYRKLEDDTPSGPIADHYARAPTNVIRLACLFALLDGKGQISDVHLDAAIAVWNHSDRTLRYLFASDVNEDAERVKIALRASPEGLTKYQLTRLVFGGRLPLGVDGVLTDLLAERTILAKKVQPKRGRPATLYLWNVW